MSNIINKIKRLNSIKFRFDFPKQKKILQFDEINSHLLKKAIRKNFNILPRHAPEFNFWIFLKQVIFLDFRFITYFKNYIKITSPKIVINQIDNDLSFYTLKNNFKGIHFIAIQNGQRPPYSPMFKKKYSNNFKNLNCDHIFLFNKYLIKEYEKIIKSKYHVLGNFTNNMVKINKTKYKNSFLFISQYKNYLKKKRPHDFFIDKLLKLLNLYFSNSKRKLNILLRSKNISFQKDEMNFYRKFFKSNCIFHKSTSWSSSHKIVDKFENIIFMNSCLGYEAISRKKKIAILYSMENKKKSIDLISWPSTKSRKGHNFFLTNKLDYKEIKRVLENIYNCSQINWDKKYYKILKDLMYFDKNNTKLNIIINNILNYQK